MTHLLIGIKSVKKGRVALRDHPSGAEIRFSIDQISSEAPNSQQINIKIINVNPCSNNNQIYLYPALSCPALMVNGD
jgi:hypothetical protein